MTLIKRTTKGSELTFAEMDGNLDHLESLSESKYPKIQNGTGNAINLSVLETLVGIGFSLSGANLSYGNLSNATLTYGNLTYANLTGANLNSANLTYANLTNGNLNSADLSYANLTGADLNSADLSYANLTGADLNSANLTNGNLGYGYLYMLNVTNLAAFDPNGTGLIGDSSDPSWSAGRPTIQWVNGTYWEYTIEDTWAQKA